MANEDNTFWVSYSDLATGLMIVFMLVMLIMVMIQKKATEAQTETISEITSKLEIILGEKSKLGRLDQRCIQRRPHGSSRPCNRANLDR